MACSWPFPILGTSRVPDKIGSRAGPGPRAVSCMWLAYINKEERLDGKMKMSALCILPACRIDRMS